MNAYKALIATLALSTCTMQPALAEDYSNVKELYLATDVGHVVLTVEPCDIKFDQPSPFTERAYATEGDIVHEGCWYRSDSRTVNIYFPEINATATYKASNFLPYK